MTTDAEQHGAPIRRSSGDSLSGRLYQEQTLTGRSRLVGKPHSRDTSRSQARCAVGKKMDLAQPAVSVLDEPWKPIGTVPLHFYLRAETKTAPALIRRLKLFETAKQIRRCRAGFA